MATRDQEQAPRAVNGWIRRPAAPERAVDDLRVLARPADGAPVVLRATAAMVWDRLESWTTVDEVAGALASSYPDVPDDERRRTLEAILVQLEGDGLLERR